MKNIRLIGLLVIICLFIGAVVGYLLTQTLQKETEADVEATGKLKLNHIQKGIHSLQEAQKKLEMLPKVSYMIVKTWGPSTESNTPTESDNFEKGYLDGQTTPVITQYVGMREIKKKQYEYKEYYDGKILYTYSQEKDEWFYLLELGNEILDPVDTVEGAVSLKYCLSELNNESVLRTFEFESNGSEQVFRLEINGDARVRIILDKENNLKSIRTFYPDRSHQYQVTAYFIGPFDEQIKIEVPDYVKEHASFFID